MKYRVNSSWPVQGGSRMVGTNTVVDDTVWPWLAGIVPPPDTTPLDEETRDWLVRAYQLPDHNWTIAPVPPVDAADDQTNKSAKLKVKSKQGEHK